MPRLYNRQTNKACWTADNLVAAIAAVRSGRAVREVSRTFEIPRSTIQKRMKNNHTEGPSLGRLPVFSKVEEKQLAAHVLKISKLFYGVSRLEIKKCAYDYAEKNNLRCPFNNEKKSAGDDWLCGFLRRNPSVVLRKPEPTSINRITAFNKEQVSLFFKNLYHILTKYKCKECRIFNTDETGISTVQKPGKILAQKGVKQVGFATSWERGRNITVVCAFSASGIYVPPMFIYGRKRMHPLLKKGGPPGAAYCCSDKGWITEELFIQYLKHFQEFVKASLDDPVLLIMDNHSTHCTLEAYVFCKANGIILLTIPPHTSHRLQPLDVTFYGPLKTAFNTECSKYLKNHAHEKITPFEIAELFSNAYMRVATLEKAVKGFQVTGIWPYNPDIFSEEDFAAADLHNVNITPVDQQERLEAEVASEPNSTTETSFEDILPLPGPSQPKRETIKRRQSKKQTSQIITSTPNKDVLIAKSNKKVKKKEINRRVEAVKKKLLLDDNNQKDVTKAKRVKLQRCAKRRSYNDSRNSDEYSNDEDDEDKDKNVVYQDICLVCGEFGKNNEIWLRCVSCGNWAHKACAAVETKDDYICDYCT
ncbi:hypothetical protein MTP99_005878 [Tenebrio molitor]|jgi:hypothetical protein|nr:hypothetical protein MTP99_005878 [Tenebrio molitor]